MDRQIMLLIVAMALVSYIPRALPLLIFNKKEFPPVLVKWLGFIPVAVLASLLLPDLFIFEGRIVPSLAKVNILAATTVVLVAISTKSMIWALLSGMGSYALFKLFL